MHVCTLCVCLVPGEARRGCQIVWSWDHRGCEEPCRSWELKAGLQPDQRIVLMMSHLQPSGNVVLQLSIAWLMSSQQASFSEEESEELIEFTCQFLKKTGNSQLPKIENQGCDFWVLKLKRGIKITDFQPLSVGFYSVELLCWGNVCNYITAALQSLA